MQLVIAHVLIGAGRSSFHFKRLGAPPEPSTAERRLIVKSSELEA